MSKPVSELDHLRALAAAARRYFVGYVQDEAAERECCLSDEQHEDAQALEQALADVERYGH
jgi:hypothetical protein